MKKQLAAVALAAAMVLGACGSAQTASSTVTAEAASEAVSESAVSESTASESEAVESGAEAAESAETEAPEGGDIVSSMLGQGGADAASVVASATPASMLESKIEDLPEVVASVSASDVEGILSALDGVENGAVNYSFGSQKVQVLKEKEEDTETDKSDVLGKIGESVDENDVFGMMIGSDDRFEMSDEITASYPSCATVFMVVEYEGEIYYQGTGALIDGNSVVTAASAIYNPDLGGWPVSVTVIPAFLTTGETPYGMYAATDAEIMVDFYTSANVADVTGDDWASYAPAESNIGVLTLESDLSAVTGYYGLASLVEGSVAGMGVYNLAYDDNADFVAAEGTVTDSTDGLLFFDSDTDETMTGSPLFIADDYDYSVIGLVTGTGYGQNVGVRFTEDSVNWILDTASY